MGGGDAIGEHVASGLTSAGMFRESMISLPIGIVPWCCWHGTNRTWAWRCSNFWNSRASPATAAVAEDRHRWLGEPMATRPRGVLPGWSSRAKGEEQGL